jgi:stearoyl-CoA desaturase (delta-9 desaturase)
MGGWSSFTLHEAGWMFLAGLAISQLNVYLVTAVLHRGMCHRAISYPDWLKRVVAVWLWLTVCTSSLGWIAAHLHHHANSDTADDPHSPTIKGFWQVLLLTWYYVAHWARVNRKFAEERYLASFRDEELLHRLDDYRIVTVNFYAQAIGSLILGPCAIAFWVARFVPYLLASGYVNSVAHTAGRRPFGTTGTDATGVTQKIFGYLVGGEPLGHNYHHRHPTSATFRIDRFDPGFWFAVRILRGIPRDAASR